MEDKVFEKVVDLLSDYTDFDRDAITLDTEVVMDLGLNSLDVVNIAVEFEKAFNVSIPDRDLTGFSTVGSVVDYLKAKGIE